MKKFTLVLVIKESQVLLGLKKRGLGEGKWNGFGGKVEDSETVIHAAARELEEESGVIVEEKELTPCGIIDMYFPHGKIPYKVYVFRCYNYQGQITETDEMKPCWFNINHLPYNRMWSEARIWYPVFLSGTSFHGKFTFDDQDEMVDYKITTDLQKHFFESSFL